MRRLLWAIAALALFATAAPAKILVVTETLSPQMSAGSEAQIQNFNASYYWQEQRLLNAFIDVAKRTNMNYRMVPATSMRTAWARGAYFLNNWSFDGTGEHYTSKEQYDGVIILNAIGRAKNSVLSSILPNPPTAFWACSLTVYNNLPKFPVAFLFGAHESDPLSNGVIGVFKRLAFGGTVTAAPVCSCGVSPGAWSGTNALASPSLFYSNMGGYKWFSSANVYAAGSMANTTNDGFVVNPATAGGVRSLITAHIPQVLSEYVTPRKVPSWNYDSLYAGLGADTSTVWERMLAGQNGGATNPNTRIIYANLMGVQPCADSLGTANPIYSGPGTAPTPCEFDESICLYVLAHLDSLTGGKVWDAPAGIKVVKAAVTIDGGFSRGGRRFAGGIVPSDSATFMASMDSLRTLGIPITVGVNVDSMSNYASEKNWWPRAGSVRYSPQAWAGVKKKEDGTMDTSGVYSSLGNTAALPVDIFGRFRKRQAYGDGSLAGADTASIYSGLVLSRAIVQSYFPGQVSGLLMAPLDDYSPKNLLWPYNAGPGPDSLLWVFNKAGFTCLRTDVQAADAHPGRIGPVRPPGGPTSKDLLRGYWPTQGYVYSALIGGNFKVLGQTGYHISGSDSLFNFMQDSTSAQISNVDGNPGGSNADVLHLAVGRWWHGLMHDQFRDVDWAPMTDFFLTDQNGNILWDRKNPKEDTVSPFRHASILKMHASDFGGIPNGPPTRPGWWQLKSMQSAFSAINAAAGRTVCAFTWPEDLNP